MTQQKQIALITGASRGIGKAIALDFAKNNIDVVLTGRNEKRLIDIHNELQSYDINSYYISSDLSNNSGIEKIMKFVSDTDLEINILVNNAGIIHPRIHLVDFNMKDWEEVINVNLVNAVKLTKLILPFMIKQQYGKIVNISKEEIFN